MAGWRLQPGGAGLKARSSRRAAHCRLGLGFVRVRLGLSALPLRATERLLAPLVREEAVVVGVQRARGRDGHASAEQQLARRLTRLAGGCAVAGAAHARVSDARSFGWPAFTPAQVLVECPDAPTPSVSRHATRKAVAKRCGVLHVGTRPASKKVERVWSAGSRSNERTNERIIGRRRHKSHELRRHLSAPKARIQVARTT